MKKRFWILLALSAGVLALSLNCVRQNRKFRDFDD